MDGKVSIIVPVYKVEDYLSRCLDSLICQTYRNIEIILVDDGSPDKSGFICDEYAKKDKRIKVIHQENRGVSAARNAGLQIAEGEYIGFVDSDDYIEPEMYERMVESINDEIDLVICGSYACNTDGLKQEKMIKPLYSYEKECPGDALLSVLYQHVTMAVWSKLFRKNKIMSETGQLKICFSENLNNYEDLIFICEYICGCKGRLYFLPERLYNYCIQKDSLSHREKTFEEILTSLYEVLRLQKKYENMVLKYADLFFEETIWKYWIDKVAKSRKYKRLKDFKEHEKIKSEVLSCKETYYRSPYVKKYKKVIVYMLLKHEYILFFVTKLVGCLIK